MFGINHSLKSLNKISLAKNKILFVYSSDTPTILSYEFLSYSEAAIFFNSNNAQISRYKDTDKLFINKTGIYLWTHLE